MQELDSFRSLLCARRAELESVAEGADAAGATVELDQSRVGRLSRMDALQAQAMAQESGRRRRLELQRISAALARIDAGEYGYCLRCDEPITVGRLHVDLSATLCITCAHAAS